MPGDVDNIVKPILDVLGRHIYVDDAQVERVVVEKFEPKNVFAFRAPSPTHRKCGASPEAGALHTTEQRSIRGLDMNEVEQSRQVLDQLIRTSKRKGIRYVSSVARPAASLHERLCSRCHSARPEENLAIEIKVEGSVSKQPQRFTPRFDEDENWELRVYYARPAGLQDRVSTTTNSIIATFIVDVEKLTGEGRGARLCSWLGLRSTCTLVDLPPPRSRGRFSGATVMPMHRKTGLPRPTSMQSLPPKMV
jgi:hypothetical protein